MCIYEYEYENEICKKPHVEQPRPPTVVSDPTGENSTDPEYSWSSPCWCIYRLQLEFTILVYIQITVGVHHFMYLQITDYIYSSPYWCVCRSMVY